MVLDQETTKIKMVQEFHQMLNSFYPGLSELLWLFPAADWFSKLHITRDILKNAASRIERQFFANV